VWLVAAALIPEICTAPPRGWWQQRWTLRFAQHFS